MIRSLPPRWQGIVVAVLGMLFAVPAAPASEHFRVRADTTVRVGPDEFLVDTGVFDADFGQRHEIVAVPLLGDRDLVVLEIERFRVFAPNAKIVVHSADGDRIHPTPKNFYYRGRVEGEPDSTVVMTVLDGGLVRGLIVRSGRYWVFSGDSINKSIPVTLRVREVEPVVELEHDAQGFECATDTLEMPPRPGSENGIEISYQKAAGYTARIAVETDNEFFNLFGDSTDATNYVADIIAFGSAMYSAEVNTSWVLQHLSLWPTGNADPWSQSSPDCGLYEFGRYWNDFNQSIFRTTAAFFSGNTINAGIAWAGVLCYGPFNVNLGQACSGLSPSIDNYGGEYAYIGGMDGNFDLNSPGVVWDIVAVTHEIGHNFDSPHTHCYAGVGGNANQIDECYSGEIDYTGTYTCYSGPTSLPSGCPGPGNGCGTIMSYCHQRPGGLSNMSLTLGQSHPYGIAPDRVPSHMSAHVSSQAASHPGCLDYIDVEGIFSDDFESGNTNAWSITIP